MRLSSALTVLSLIAGATAAGSAAPVPVEDPLGRAIAAVQKVALAGPRQAELVHEAVLNVPAGDAIIPSPQADAFMAALGNARNPARVAADFRRTSSSTPRPKPSLPTARSANHSCTRTR